MFGILRRRCQWEIRCLERQVPGSSPGRGALSFNSTSIGGFSALSNLEHTDTGSYLLFFPGTHIRQIVLWGLFFRK